MINYVGMYVCELTRYNQLNYWTDFIEILTVSLSTNGRNYKFLLKISTQRFVNFVNFL